MRSPELSEKLIDYAMSHSQLPSDLCLRLRREAIKKFQHPEMQIDPLTASFLCFVIQMTGAKRVLELGCYVGFSALAMAEALPAKGRLTTVDKNEDYARWGQSFWEQSPSGQKIDLIVGEARQVLDQMSEKFDLIFIDADKIHYPLYLDMSLKLLNEKGILIFDNVFKGGKVLEGSGANGKGVQAVRELNTLVRNLTFYRSLMLPLRDGLTLIQKS